MTDTIFKSVISLILIILTTLIIPFIRSKINQLKDDKLKQIIWDAVWAAQQTLTDNTQKKEYVLTLVTDWLKQNNINITPAELDTMIESAVLAMKCETR